MEILIYKPNYICTYEHMLLYVHQFIFTYVHVNFVQWNQYGFKKVSIIPKRCFIYIRGVFEGPSLGGLNKNHSSKTHILVGTLPLFSYLPALTLKFSLHKRQFYSYTMFNFNQQYCNFIIKYLELEEKNISPTSLTKCANNGSSSFPPK